MWCLLCKPPKAGVVVGAAKDNSDSSEDAFASMFKDALDKLPDDLKEKAAARKQSITETGWIPCPRCKRDDIPPNIPCCNPYCSVRVHDGCGYVTELRDGEMLRYCRKACRDVHFYASRKA